jgi:acetolactate decarboxylase
MNSKRIVILAFAVGAVTTAAWAATAAYQVQWKGQLRATHAGDVSGKVPLAELPRSPQLYAVGPVADRGGEITVIDGRLHLARVEHGKLETSAAYRGQASFLVWATVPQWQKAVPLGQPAASHAELERLIEGKARRAGLDADGPSPFLLRGPIASVKYHVLRPSQAQGGHMASISHTASALNVQASGEHGTIVGFFSKKHEGVFTHSGSHAHLHVLLASGDSGHVDELQLGPAVELLLPHK